MNSPAARFTLQSIMLVVASFALLFALMRLQSPLATLIGGTVNGALVQRTMGGRWVVGGVTGGIIAYCLLLGPRYG